MIYKKILILEGGFNEEHEVSLKTSSEIQKILRNLKIKFDTLLVNPLHFEKQINKYKDYVCFNALHGPFGEDGQIQKILSKNKIKYTHSSVKSSRVCFDKVETKKIVSKNKILTPKYFTLKKKDLNSKNLLKIKKSFTNFIIKPCKSGSSYGIKIINNNKEFKNFFNNFEKFKDEIPFHEDILIEEFIKGKELTVSTINYLNDVKALGVTEIKYKNTYFDYKAKYSKSSSKHILPANLTKKNYNKCLKLALKCHKILECKSIARTDFIYNSKKNKIYYLETNTQPGLTSVSLLPEQAKFNNISFEAVILEILKNLN